MTKKATIPINALANSQKTSVDLDNLHIDRNS